MRALRFSVFGLTVSSSWGNGHATLWRGLIRALGRRGHRVTFFEWDAPWYAPHRDLGEADGLELVLYPDWEQVLPVARERVRRSDVTVVTSYCPDALRAQALAREDGTGLRIFYDLDSAVTLGNLAEGVPVEYVGPDGYASYHLVLSYTGGRALEMMRDVLGARRVAPLYGWADPDRHFPVEPEERLRSALSFLGTYAPDRQRAFERLFLEPARALPERRFVLGGSLYPAEIPWPANVVQLPHVPPPRHPVFHSSAELSLNLTRGAMAALGYCPSGRLFEAAACGAAVLSDAWEGLDEFFEPGREILIAETTEDALRSVRLPASEKRRVGRAARARCLADHTADRRALELLALIGAAEHEREPGDVAVEL